jgi:D-alanyl-lipoteichoic acid acyltransferase DltB (MBOAT superfamily)
MSFINWQYFLFLPLVFILYWQLPSRLRLPLLLGASYFFYACWDVRFLALVLTTTVIDYICGLSLGGQRLKRPWVLLLALLPATWLGVCYLLLTAWGQVTPWLFGVAGGLGLTFFALHEGVWAWGGEKRNKGLLIFSVGFCLAILGFFKYFNFFVDSAQNLLGLLGLQANFVLLHIILPVGISFYTFQSLGYVIDVYRGTFPACADFLTFATFDAFFPQMVSGPIERGKNLIPQLEGVGVFHNSYIHDGLRLILVGLFKKVFVADNCAIIAGYVFDPQTPLNAPWAILGVVAFAFQIYGDFSGYTDIARGSAKLLGINLMENFRFPYSARNPSDFWSRWHISLSTWFRDYVYIPLGGNRGGKWDTINNLAVTMLLAGLWHGANWIFVIWGAYHGALLILYRFVPPLTGFMVKEEKVWWRGGAAAALMFLLTLAGWAIFRSANLAQLGQWIAALGHWQAGALPWQKSSLWLLFHIAPLLVLQALTWKQRDEARGLERLPWPVRGLLYTALLLMVVSSSEQDQEFIYFQF